MGTFSKIARQGKDLAVSKALEALGQHYAGKFGTIESLKLDSANREIHLELLLKGEQDPITVCIKGYDIISDKDRYFIVASDIAVSREWMETLAREYVCGRKFEIPQAYSKVLGMIA